MDLAFLAPRADHDPGLHATRVVIGEQAAGCRTFIIRVRADHEQHHARLTTALGDARRLHVPSSLCVPSTMGHPATAMAVWLPRPSHVSFHQSLCVWICCVKALSTARKHHPLTGHS